MLLTWQDSPGKSRQIQSVCALKKQQSLSSPNYILLCRENLCNDVSLEVNTSTHQRGRKLKEKEKKIT